MEIRHLRYFLAVADTGNVTRAAQECFIAQSALSAQIARLEADLGNELFVRSSRGMRLTPAGDAVRPLAIRLLADAARIETEMSSLRGVVSGRLRLGMIQGPPAPLDLVELVASFHQMHPDVELHAHTGASEELARNVRTGTLDLAVVALPRDELGSALIATPLVDDPLVAILPLAVDLPPGPVSMGQVAGCGPFIHYRTGSGLRRSVLAAFDRAGIEVGATFELDQITDMVRLVSRGVGVTIVPASVVRLPEFADARTYRAAPLSDAQAVHALSVVTGGSPAPAVSAFTRLLVANAAAIG